MAGLFTYGLVLATSIIVGLIFTAIGLLPGHVILFDSTFLAAIGGIICNQTWYVYPALCIVIATVLFTILFWLQGTRAGSWTIGALLSVFWVFAFGLFAHIFTSEDTVWFYVAMGLRFILMMGLHLKTRDS